MESLLNEFIINFTLPDIASLIGGLIGALIRIDKKRDGMYLTVLLVIASIIFAAAIGDGLEDRYALINMWWRFGAGIITGLIAGSLIDAIRLAAPDNSKKLIDKTLDIGIDRVTDIAKVIGGTKPNPKEGNDE